MRDPVIRAARGVVALALAGSVGVQVLLVPLLWADLRDTDATAFQRGALVTIVVLGVVALQVVGVCLWRLLAMVRSGTVFSHAAFGYVDVVIGALATGAALVLALAFLLAPGDAAPGVVGLVCGAAVVIGGVALIVGVLRLLLAQAVALDHETRVLQAELDGVI